MHGHHAVGIRVALSSRNGALRALLLGEETKGIHSEGLAAKLWIQDKLPPQTPPTAGRDEPCPWRFELNGFIRLCCVRETSVGRTKSNGGGFTQRGKAIMSGREMLTMPRTQATNCCGDHRFTTTWHQGVGERGASPQSQYTPRICQRTTVPQQARTSRAF